MKSVLISLHPKWWKKIRTVIGHDKKFKLIYEKSVEVRKTRPKLDVPFRVFIYETKAIDRSRLIVYVDGDEPSEYYRGCGKVVGEFVCDKVDRIAHCGTCNNDIRLRIVDKNLFCKELDSTYLNKCQLSYSDIDKYSKGCDVYGWHLSDLVIYDKPRELRDFRKVGVCPCNAKSILRCTENMSFCANRNLTRPPQSWCYVESEV